MSNDILTMIQFLKRKHAPQYLMQQMCENHSFEIDHHTEVEVDRVNHERWSSGSGRCVVCGYRMSIESIKEFEERRSR